MKTKTMIEKIKNCKKKKFIPVVLLGVVAIFWFTGIDDSQQIYVVGQHDVEQVVLLSGSVRAVGQVDVSFDASGKISTTAVVQGDVVVEGQILAELDYAALEADLLLASGAVRSAQSNVSFARASVQKAEANLALVQAKNRGTDSSIEAAEIFLANTITEQEIIVQNAYQDLLNNDLTAYSVDSSRNVPSPTISGSYSSNVEGEYILDFYTSGANTGYSIRVSNLGGGIISPDDYGIPASLATNGLYVTIPESGRSYSYGSTKWTVPVPNVRSETYHTKLGLFEKSKQTQSSAVAKAQSSLNTLIAQQEDGTSVAITTAQEQQAVAALQEAESNLSRMYGALIQTQAGFAKVEAQINNSIIRAPFDGTIARIDFEVGQSVSPGFAGITVITNGEYELAMNIPETDIAKVAVGDVAEIILDAYGTDEVWSGVLTEIDLVETSVDGVPTYASVITLSDSDKRIKIGMNARARIVIQEKLGVISVPSSYVVSGDTSTVLVKVNDRQTEQRVVQTGLVGTDYFVEITQGLQDGEIIINPTNNTN